MPAEPDDQPQPGTLEYAQWVANLNNDMENAAIEDGMDPQPDAEEIRLDEDELTDAGRHLRSAAAAGSGAMTPWSFVPCAREHTPGRLCILPDGHPVGELDPDDPDPLITVIARATHCSECEGTGMGPVGYDADMTPRFGPCQTCTPIVAAVFDWLARHRMFR